MPSLNRWWKLLGLAAVAGVAATGAVIDRQTRTSTAYAPSEITAHLRRRFQEARERAADSAAGLDGSE